jgi:CRP/FNR family transcriptional regulator, cyclic AMP receptor protein
MLSMKEKILILKSVSIFSETPDESLAEVIDILEEVQVPAGARIFAKGDLGTCMYIIVDGRVRVHDGERTLNFLERRQVFGEMAALDTQPRVAAVTAVEDTLLFRIDQKPLYDLMTRRIEVVQGIIHVLCQHMRARVRDMAEDFKYMQQFARVTAAAEAVEAGIFEPESLDEVAQRTDALGQLARVFQRMTQEVYNREQRLKQEVQELRIEIDQTKKQHSVSEITETDYFRSLQLKLKDLRQR